MAVAATGIPAESGEPAMDKPRMKGRHLVMMSLGSAIGTGLFVGSGKGVAAAGPATFGEISSWQHDRKWLRYYLCTRVPVMFWLVRASLSDNPTLSSA